MKFIFLCFTRNSQSVPITNNYQSTCNSIWPSLCVACVVKKYGQFFAVGLSPPAPPVWDVNAALALCPAGKQNCSKYDECFGVILLRGRYCIHGVYFCPGCTKTVMSYGVFISQPIGQGASLLLTSLSRLTALPRGANGTRQLSSE